MVKAILFVALFCSAALHADQDLTSHGHDEASGYSMPSMFSSAQVAKMNDDAAKAAAAAAAAAAAKAAAEQAGDCPYDYIGNLIEPQAGKAPLHAYSWIKQARLLASGTGCTKGKYVKNGASCTFKVNDANLQSQGVKCEHALCKDGVWSTVQPYCCCIATPGQAYPNICPVEGRCLKCPSGRKDTWVTMTPSDVSEIERGKDTLKIALQEKDNKNYASRTYLTATTEDASRKIEDKIQVYRNAPGVGEPACYGTLNRRTRVIELPADTILDGKKLVQVTYMKGVLCMAGDCSEKKSIVYCLVYEGLAAGVSNMLTCARGNTKGDSKCQPLVTKTKGAALEECMKMDGFSSVMEGCGAMCAEAIYGIQCDTIQHTTSSSGSSRLNSLSRYCSSSEATAISTLI